MQLICTISGISTFVSSCHIRAQGSLPFDFLHVSASVMPEIRVHSSLIFYMCQLLSCQSSGFAPLWFSTCVSSCHARDQGSLLFDFLHVSAFVMPEIRVRSSLIFYMCQLLSCQSSGFAPLWFSTSVSSCHTRAQGSLPFDFLHVPASVIPELRVRSHLIFCMCQLLSYQSSGFAPFSTSVSSCHTRAQGSLPFDFLHLSASVITELRVRSRSHSIIYSFIY